MKTRTIKHLAASALVLGMLATVQTATAGPQGIKNSRHNLGSGDLAIGATAGARTTGLAGSTGLGDVFTTKTDQICVFCHTPHGSNTAVDSAPLWNRATGTATYQIYSTGTMQASAPGTSLSGSASLACLSCHDGTQAMDNVLNAPGQGGFNRVTYSDGNRMGQQLRAPGNTAGSSGIWYSGGKEYVSGGPNGASVGSQNLIGPTGSCSDPLGTSGASGCVPDTADGHLTSDAGVDFLGTDMRNDHPIAIAYGGGNCNVTGVDAAGGCADSDFKGAQAGLAGSFQVGSATPGDKQAMRLYGSTLASATVECASCHDPHTDAAPTFLRKSNAGSAVCLTCHTK